MVSIRKLIVPIALAGEQGLEPQVTVLETVGLPLTDSPIKTVPTKSQNDDDAYLSLDKPQQTDEYAYLTVS